MPIYAAFKFSSFCLHARDRRKSNKQSKIDVKLDTYIVAWHHSKTQAVNCTTSGSPNWVKERSGPGPVVDTLSQCHQSAGSAHLTPTSYIGIEQHKACHVKSKSLHQETYSTLQSVIKIVLFLALSSTVPQESTLPEAFTAKKKIIWKDKDRDCNRIPATSLRMVSYSELRQ